MPTSASDQELLMRQAALQAEAAQVLAELDLGQLFADVGPVLVVGSYRSGLMCWRDLDVCLLAGVECSPSDVLELLKRRLSDVVYRCLLADQHDQRRPAAASG
jgi:hypothetical protein